MDGHAHEPLSDDAFEQEIEAVLAIDPSPGFQARIRTRVAAGSVSLGLRGLSWAPACLAVAGVVVLALWVANARGPAVSESPRAVAPPAGEPSAPVAASAARPVMPARHEEAPAHARRSVASDVSLQPHADAASRSAVLISQEEAAALRRLFAAIHQGQVEPSVLPDLDSPSGPIAPIEELVLEPITLSPLVRLDGE